MLFLAFLIVLSPDALAQSDPGSDPWSFTFLGGFKSHGGAKDLEQAMRSSDFDDTLHSFFGGDVAHPFSSGGGSALSVDGSYRFRASWAVGLAYTRGSEGRTLGFHETTTGQFLEVSHTVSTIAPKISRVFGIAYVGAGPALHRVRISQVTHALGGDSLSRRHSKVGFIAEAGVKVPLPPRLPAGIRILVDVKLQYRHVGRATAGPYTPASFIGNPATFPASNISFNDWFFGIGPGLRF